MGIASFPALFPTWTGQTCPPLPTSCTAQGQEHGDTGSRPSCREGLKLWGIFRVSDFRSEQDDHTPQLTGFTPEVQASKSPKTSLTSLTAHGLWPQHWLVLGQPCLLLSQAGTRAPFLSEGLLSAVWSVARLSWVVTEGHMRSPNPLEGERWGLPPAESSGASRLSAPNTS